MDQHALLIFTGRLDAVAEALGEGGGAQEAIAFDNALIQAVRARLIARDEALQHADSSDNLQSRMAFAA